MGGAVGPVHHDQHVWLDMAAHELRHVDGRLPGQGQESSSEIGGSPFELRHDPAVAGEATGPLVLRQGGLQGHQRLRHDTGAEGEADRLGQTHRSDRPVPPLSPDRVSPVRVSPVHADRMDPGYDIPATREG